MPFKITSLSPSLPSGLGSVSAEVGEAERSAAWDLYVEFTTRVSTQKFTADTASVHEALASPHALFDVTRQVLKEAGSVVGGQPDALDPGTLEEKRQGLSEFVTVLAKNCGVKEPAEDEIVKRR